MSAFNELMIAHAVGALEPGDALALQQRLASDAVAAFHQAGLTVLAGSVKPGLRRWGMSAQLETGMHLGAADHHRIGDRVQARIEAPVPADQARCVLIRQLGEALTVVHPTPEAPWPSLDRFRQEGNVRVLDLVLEPPAGLQRFALILVPVDLFEQVPGPAAPVWRAMLEAHQLDQLPGFSFDVTVEA